MYWNEGISNSPTETGLELPQNSLMMVGIAVSLGAQAKTTKLSVAFQENSTSVKLMVVLVTVNPSGAAGTVCMCMPHTIK